jgi:serine O-acetyltransferase
VSEELLIQRLVESRRKRCFPGRLHDIANNLTDALLSLLFPHYSTVVTCDDTLLRGQLKEVKELLEKYIVSVQDFFPDIKADLTTKFVGLLADVHERLLEDAQTIDAFDPASTSIDEVILAYPGFYAIAVHRLAHALQLAGFPLLPRLVAECAHARTGVDIHPGAQIGRNFCIDHGTGVVIGESAIVGDNVKIYQGVTLGSLTVSKGLAAKKRHPTIEDNVVIYANATILGGTTVVGKGSVIGGNAWLTRSVPAGAIVTHQSDIRVRAPGEDMPVDYQI